MSFNEYRAAVDGVSEIRSIFLPLLYRSGPPALIFYLKPCSLLCQALKSSIIERHVEKLRSCISSNSRLT